MALAGWFCLTSAGFCGDKIVVLDMARVIRAHPDTPAAEELLEQQAREIKSEHQGMMDRFEDMKNELRSLDDEIDSSALSAEGKKLKTEDRDKLRNRLIALDQEIQENALARRREISDQGRRMRDRIISKIQEVVRRHVQEEGILLVLDASVAGPAGSGAVVYSIDRLDITDVVIEKVETQTRTGKSP